MEAKTKSCTFLAESCGRASTPPSPNGTHHLKVPLFLRRPLLSHDSSLFVIFEKNLLQYKVRVSSQSQPFCFNLLIE